MEAPRCRLCGEREWQHVCASGAKIVTNVTRVRVTGTPKSVTDTVTDTVPSVTDKPSSAERQKRWREAHKDKAKALRVERRHRAKNKS